MIQTLLFTKDPIKKVAILVPARDFNEEQIKKHYVKPLRKYGIFQKDIIIISLELNEQDRAPVALIRKTMKTVEPLLKKFKCTRALVCQSEYFKYLTKQKKVEVNYGYPVKSPLYPDITMFASIAASILFAKPNYQGYLNLSLTALSHHIAGKDNIFAKSVLKNVQYPETLADIQSALVQLYKYPVLTLDVETYGLHPKDPWLGSVAFAWDQVSGISFTLFNPHIAGQVRNLLKFFLQHYKGKLMFHNAPYDCKVLIWELFMSCPEDNYGMLQGLDIMFRDFDDTKILSYLATNSTTGNSLKLKQQAFEYAGNYAIDEIKDITLLSPSALMEYNLIDAVCTWFVYDKHRSTIHNDQEALYQDLFKPALKVITYMELIGVPLNMEKVLEAEQKLTKIVADFTNLIKSHPSIAGFTQLLRETAATKATAKLKKLVKTADDYPDLYLNTGSPTQLRMLFFDYLGLPKQGTTGTGLASTDDKTIQRLLVLPEVKSNQLITDLLTNINELSKATKILDTFIPAFKNKSVQKNGWWFLMGSYNLGGTVSGRLSSSGPNLMNLPSTGTPYAKLIKACFSVPPGWIFCGADFSSLEDRISALQTADPNKLKIYTDGYDGHCLRAFAYFGGQMSDIALAFEKASPKDQPAIINSIETKYPDIRQASKSPTFALTYQGTWRTLVKNFGFSESEAKSIEKNYHELYSVSDDWVDARIEQASKDGYVTLAFGLKLRTPLLPKTILNSKRTLPYLAAKEIKTAANALGQSYGLLNTRALNEFMDRVWSSRYRYDVLPIMQIHDSLYLMTRDNIDCLQWTNNNLIECMEWNMLDEIQHPVVGLEAKLEVYYPSWAKKATIPNKASKHTIQKRVSELILDAK